MESKSPNPAPLPPGRARLGGGSTSSIGPECPRGGLRWRERREEAKEQPWTGQEGKAVPFKQRGGARSSRTQDWTARGVASGRAAPQLLGFRRELGVRAGGESGFPSTPFGSAGFGLRSPHVRPSAFPGVHIPRTKFPSMCSGCPSHTKGSYPIWDESVPGPTRLSCPQSSTLSVQ